MESTLKKTVNILRLIIGLFLAVIMLVAGSMAFVKNMVVAFAFMREGVSAVPHILEGYGTAFMIFSMGLIAVRFAFPEKLREKVKYRDLVITFIIFSAFTAGMSIWDENITSRFKNQSYMPWVESTPSKSAYAVQTVDYGKDVISIGAYPTFLKNNFKDDNPVEVVKDDKMTDKIAVEVYYRGDDVEIYISDYDEDGLHISVWEENWVDGLTTEDLVSMYKYGVDIEYADRFALEKMVIRTAYPEKLDISGISIN